MTFYKKNQISHFGGNEMRYSKITNKLNKNQVINKKDLYNMYQKNYNNDNYKSFSNMLSYLKNNNILTETKRDQYMVITKEKFEYYEIKKEIEKKLYKIIYQTYPKINFIIWNTKILNNYTLHYVMKNYIIIETEKYAVDIFIDLLKENLSRKYNILTQDVLNKYRNLYINDENIIVVKPLRTKSPLDNVNGKKVISIEKIMVDLYVDKLYLYYQGRELQTIYENIFERYDINMKRLLVYAELRTEKEKYINFLNNIHIPMKYKKQEKQMLSEQIKDKKIQKN